MEVKSMTVLTTMLIIIVIADWFYTKKLLLPVYEKEFGKLKKKLYK